jgi:phytoene dehydrogenase-like protein
VASRHDAIIVGGGHNGLVCGAYLAKAGLRALVLERRTLIGGACVTEETWPGYKVSTGAYVMSLMQPKIMLDLELKRHGLTVLPTPPSFLPMSACKSIVFWPEEERICAEFAQFSKNDAAAYPEYMRVLRSLTPFIRQIIWETPPNIASSRLRDLWQTARFLFRQRRYADRLYAIYDILTMCAFDYLKKWFESDEVITALGYYAPGSGTNVSMKTPGSAFALIRPLVRDNTTAAGSGGLVRGGMGSISNAIAASGREHGLEIRTDADVTRIDCSEGVATGVTLRSGERLESNCVIANTDAKTTFLKLAADSGLPDGFIREVKAIRTQSSIFKVHLAVRQLPQYTAFSANERGFSYPASVRIAPNIDYLERAYSDYREGRFSQRPFLAIFAPSLIDDTVAPKNMHILSIMGGHAPYALKHGNWDDARESLLATTLDTIEQFAPNFRRHVAHSEVLTPLDLEMRFGLPNGHVHHGDLTIDQQFIRRPVGGFADYRTPIRRLYLCGSSTHPGGGVTGVPGHNAAQEILKDRRKLRLSA